MKNLEIRASSLDGFEPCPRKFYFGNFRRDIPGIGHPAALLGTAVHAGIAKYWTNRMEGRFEPSDSTDAGLAALDEELISRPYDGVNRSEVWRKTSFLSVWYAIGKEGNQEEPVGVEMEVMGYPVEGITLTGHPDLILKDLAADHHKLIVVDHKLRKVPITPVVASKLRQLTGYAYFYGLGWLKNEKGKIVDMVDCRIDNIVTGPMDQKMPSGAQGNPELREIPTSRNLDDLAEMKQFLKEIRERGDNPQNYPPRATNLCSACSYRAVCPSGQGFLKARNIPLYNDFAAIREQNAA